MDRLFSNVSTHWRISGQSSKAKVRDTAPDQSAAPGQTEKLGAKNQPTSLVTSSESGSTPPVITTTCLAPDTSGTANNRLSVMSGAPGDNAPGKKTAAGGEVKKSVAVRKSSRKLSTRMDSEVIDAFRLFDRDKDGRITKSEIENLIASLDGDPKCPQVKELIEAAEKNAKGSIDQAEFMTLWVAFKAKVGEEGETEAEIKTAFKEYDLDGDGYITKDEMVEAITKMGFVSNTEEEAGKCLKEMDLDGDGKVSYAEFMVKWKIT